MQLRKDHRSFESTWEQADVLADNEGRHLANSWNDTNLQKYYP